MAKGTRRGKSGQGGGGSGAAAGHNGGGPSQAVFLEHFDAIGEKLRVKKTADAALANAYKAAERDGLDRKDLKFAIAESLKGTDEREVSHARRLQYLAWLGKPVGHQGDIFGAESAAPEPTPEDTAAVERHENNVAFQKGVEAGAAGAALASCPYEIGGEEYQQFSVGWSAGQAEAVRALGGATHRAPVQEVAG